MPSTSMPELVWRLLGALACLVSGAAATPSRELGAAIVNGSNPLGLPNPKDWRGWEMFLNDSLGIWDKIISNRDAVTTSRESLLPGGGFSWDNVSTLGGGGDSDPATLPSMVGAPAPPSGSCEWILGRQSTKELVPEKVGLIKVTSQALLVFYVSHPSFFPEPYCDDLPEELCDFGYRAIWLTDDAHYGQVHYVQCGWRQPHPGTPHTTGGGCAALSEPMECPDAMLSPPPVPPPMIPSVSDDRYYNQRLTNLTGEIGFIEACDFVAFVSNETVYAVGEENACAHSLAFVWPHEHGGNFGHDGQRIAGIDETAGVVYWNPADSMLSSIPYYFGLNRDYARSWMLEHPEWDSTVPPMLGVYHLCHAKHPRVCPHPPHHKQAALASAAPHPQSPPALPLLAPPELAPELPA